MFTVYYSNQLEYQKELLIALLRMQEQASPFEKETILVQSTGMAQWLQMQIAEKVGIAGNLDFPFPTSFVWQQYRLLFPELPKENIFERELMTWRLMKIIPVHLKQPEFNTLNQFLNKNKGYLGLYQLASKIAALFDQYLVYRPHWLIHWENQQNEAVLTEILQATSFKPKEMDSINEIIGWQAILWQHLIEEIKSITDEMVFNTSHRAYLQQRYFDKFENLTTEELAKLPKRIFIFGISSFPLSQLAVLYKLSQHRDVHLFLMNPTDKDWWNDKEEKLYEKMALKKEISFEELQEIYQYESNLLLNHWGKQGKDFIQQLIDLEVNVFDESPFNHFEKENLTLLEQIKKSIFDLEKKPTFFLEKSDNSIQFNACHSRMREVEVLHNQLLAYFEQDPTLSPKDIVVMSPNIEEYAPYIQSVFEQYNKKDKRYIPFVLSDRKEAQTDPIYQSFLTLLNLKEKNLSAMEILPLLKIKSIREKFNLSNDDSYLIENWVEKSGIRAGNLIQNGYWENFNAWQNGLNRLLLGYSLKEENGIWQESIAFDESYGLNATIAAALSEFIEKIMWWFDFIQSSHSISQWEMALEKVIDLFYQENSETIDTLFNLRNHLKTLFSKAIEVNFDQEVDIDFISELLHSYLNQPIQNLHFLAGKVNCCTLLPMRAIPFKIICLLGMNEGEYPRQQHQDHFDLMQYAYQKGDRAKREDDQYLFLEALLSAQHIFYISYLGTSILKGHKLYPSILVSQLKDYISANLISGEMNRLEKNHTLAVYSQQNLKAGFISYQKEWLKPATALTKKSDFFTALTVEKSKTISLNQLIAFLQHPIKYFFNQTLSVYFKDEQFNLAESEPFDLSGLARYDLGKDFIQVEDAQVEKWFEQEKYKGILPVAYFSELVESELTENLFALKQYIKPYLSREKNTTSIALELEIEQTVYQLYAEIENDFGEEIVQWKISSLKDKDRIRCWLIFLCLIASGNIKPFSFIYLENEEIKRLSFETISADEAKMLLTRYVQDYLDFAQHFEFALYANLTAFFNVKNKAESEEEKIKQVKAHLNAINDMEYDDAVYLQRILDDDLKYLAIYQKTEAYYALMMAKKNENNIE